MSTLYSDSPSFRKRVSRLESSLLFMQLPYKAFGYLTKLVPLHVRTSDNTLQYEGVNSASIKK